MIAQLPELDVLVNNAGTNIPEPIDVVTEEHLDQLLDLNTRACFIVAQAAVKKMKEHPDRKTRGGSIINISSQNLGLPARFDNPACHLFKFMASPSDEDNSRSLRRKCFRHGCA